MRRRTVCSRRDPEPTIKEELQLMEPKDPDDHDVKRLIMDGYDDDVDDIFLGPSYDDGFDYLEWGDDPGFHLV